MSSHTQTHKGYAACPKLDTQCTYTYTTYTIITEPMTWSLTHTQFSSIGMRVKRWLDVTLDELSQPLASTSTVCTGKYTNRLPAYPLTSASSSSIHVKICVARMDDTSNSWMSWVEAMTKQLRFAWETRQRQGSGERESRVTERIRVRKTGWGLMYVHNLKS